MNRVVLPSKSAKTGIVMPTVIPRSVRVGEAPSHGRSILRYAPSSKAAIAYVDLANELHTCMEDDNEFRTTNE